MVSAPGLTQGSRSRALVETVDVASTLVELSGIGRPDHWEGTSFVPVLQDPNRQWKRGVFSQYTGKADGKKAFGKSIRTDGWRYTEWRRGPELVATELYDHRKGQLESVNLANHPEYKNIVKEHAKLLKKGHGWKAIARELQTLN